jgi:hypothetical protein
MHEPGVHTENVKEDGTETQQQTGNFESYIVPRKQCYEEISQADTTFPTEHVGTVSRTALAVSAHLYKVSQHLATYQSGSKAGEEGGCSTYTSRTYQGDAQTGSYKYVSRYNLTAYIGSLKEFLAGDEGEYKAAQ